MIKSLAFYGFDNLKDFEFNFKCENKNLMAETIKHGDKQYFVELIVSSDYYKVLDKLNDLFDMLMMMNSDSFSVLLGSEIPTNNTVMMQLEFTENDLDYIYTIKFHNDGISHERLFVNRHLKYYDKSKKQKPVLPKVVGNLLGKIVYIDLAREIWLEELIKESYNCTLSDDNFLATASNLMKKLNFTDKDLMVDSKKKQVYIFDTVSNVYIDIKESNGHIKMAFAFIKIVLETSISKNFVVVKNFGDLDITRKAVLLSIFRRLTLDNGRSQILIVDYHHDVEYKFSVNLSKVFKFHKNTSDEFYLLNMLDSETEVGE